jgi:hypothetical protein
MPKRMQSIQYSLKVFSIHSKYSVFTQATICQVREFEKKRGFLTQYVEIDNKLIDLHIDMV